MKVTLGQTKRGIILLFEDSNEVTTTIHLNYREAAGLMHELKDAFDNPAFKFRDPKGDNREVRNLKTVEPEYTLDDARRHQSYY